MLVCCAAPAQIEPDRRWRDRALAFAVGIVAALIPILVVFARARTVEPSYGVGVDELLTGARGGMIRVNGVLVGGSLTRTNSPCEHHFSLETNGFRMPVRWPSCIVSDTLEAATKDGEPTPVTVEGELQSSGFVGTNVLARVPSCCYCSPEARAKQLKAWRELQR